MLISSRRQPVCDSGHVPSAGHCQESGRRIAFLLTEEHSCYNAALGFATALRSRGNEIVFFINEGSHFAGVVADQEFAHASMRGVTPADIDSAVAAHPNENHRSAQRHARSVIVKQQRVLDLIRSQSIELCFIDSVRSDVTLLSTALIGAGVPTLLLSYTFASKLATHSPPVFSAALPAQTTYPPTFTRLRFAMAWWWALMTKGHARSYRPGEFLRQSARKFRSQLANRGFDPDLRGLALKPVWSEWTRRPDLPEIVFGHRSLDWPTIAADPRRIYFGTTDRFRSAPPLSPSWRMPSRKSAVVYCNVSTTGGLEKTTVGTLAGKRDRMAKRYLDAVVACFRRRSDWALVLTCGPFADLMNQADLPPNIHVYSRLPQLAVLPHVDLVMTWGGAGTVRECINWGVPMLLFPAWTDQFGNAARVVFHHCGLRGDIARATPTDIERLVEGALDDPAIRDGIAAQTRQCDPARDLDALVRFVHDHTGASV